MKLKTDNLKGLNCVIYARTSTSSQTENDHSILEQEARGKRYIDRHGGEHVRTYVEVASNFKTKTRPVYLEMLADAQAGKFDIVVTFSISRIFRKIPDYLQAKAVFLGAGVQLISIIADGPSDLAAEFALSDIPLTRTS